MRRSHFITSIAAVAVLLCSAASISAQVGQLRGHVLFKQADGTTIKAVGAQVDVYRTDLPGSYPTKTDKSGEFVYAGLPYVGTYILTVSMPNAQPSFQPNVKAGRDTDYEVVLSPGDGRRLTVDEAKKLAAGGGGGSSSSGGGSESAADKAKREELLKKNAEIEASNKKAENTNQIVGDAFKAGNTALTAAGEAGRANKRDEAIKLYSDAVKQYDTGLAADPEQAALLTNKAAALKGLAVEKYNAAIQTKDDAARTAGIEVAKADFKDAAETADKAFELIKKEPAATDPNDQKRHDANKYAALSVRAEAYRLYVSKGDPSKTDGGIAAFQDYMAAETDGAKKSKAQFDMAQMLLESGAGDKAFAEYQKILAAKPDDPDANLGAGLALYSTADKTKYQEAANYFQRFVDKAPDTHKFKNDAKDILANLKNTENVVPEKTTTPSRRKRP
ncbi:MAG TPA: carboxypeptidase regulatory-like domain-containing protein [Pyrinomonadaceae bacterium]|nr:carboxypeptidase regulatory-like domain-containing protein [Pyrinomonadaceae bacterium]